MATATPPRHNRRSTGATLGFVLVVAIFGAGLLGGTIGLLRGLTLGADPMLTILPLAVVAPIGGLLGVAFFLPVAVLLAAS